MTIKLFSRVNGGTARFWYVIDQIDLLKEKAFDKICRRVENGNMEDEDVEDLRFEGTGIEVYKGVIKEG